MGISRKFGLKPLLMAAAAVSAIVAAPAFARTDDPAYLEYDGGATLLGPNDFAVGQGPAGGGAFGPVGSQGPIGGFSGPSLTPHVGLSFEGVSQYDTRALNQNFSFIPPDTMGAVGATQFMETTNGGYAVFNKATGVRTLLQSDAAFWAAAGQPSALNQGVPLANGDARVMYDSISGKWIVESFAANISTIQIAVSTTSDALGPWKSTTFTGFSGGIADYPTLAMDSKAVYIGTNDFSGAAGNPYSGETLNVLNRDDIFAATGPTTTSLKQFFTPLSAINAGADPGFAIQGVNQVGGSTDFGKILSASIQTNDLITYNVNNPGTPGATTTPAVYMGTSPYIANNPGRQPSVINPQVIDTLDDRVSSAVWENRGLIYAVHTVTPPGGNHTQLVWTVSNAATGALVQQGVIGDGVYDYYQGSIAVNANGQVVIGYDRSGSSTADANGDGLADGNISFFAQTFNSTGVGTLVNTGTFLLHVSPTSDYHNGSLDGSPAAGRQRWGDYSQVTVDPDNAADFWVIGEFAREPNDGPLHPGGTGGTRWGTWIAEVDAGGFDAQAVPEPATWGLMILGFGLVGFMARRRRPLAV